MRIPSAFKVSSWSASLLFVAVVLLSAVRTSAAPIQWTVGSGGNGHYYDLAFFSNVDWYTARTIANETPYLGLPGNMANITSAAENSFIFSTFDSFSDSYAWLGGYDVGVEGTWRWADGPETDGQFSQSAAATAPYNYVNWAAGEPNDSGGAEDWAAYQLGNSGSAPTGRWVDFPHDSGGQVNAFIIEYSAGVPEPSSVAIFFIGSIILACGRRRVA